MFRVTICGGETARISPHLSQSLGCGCVSGKCAFGVRAEGAGALHCTRSTTVKVVDLRSEEEGGDNG